MPPAVRKRFATRIDPLPAGCLVVDKGQFPGSELGRQFIMFNHGGGRASEPIAPGDPERAQVLLIALLS